ncbi:MAG: efflux RND transporter periplasmic adaptor subunit [Treponema sp.]|jgi:multidrug efflux pump subunit AcrA (membrane-fusion protein)|nr:efflux RND transporter periplasmic adaptor subunit [Treponema sp.]
MNLKHIRNHIVLVFLVFSACRGEDTPPDGEAALRVHGQAVTVREIADEVSGFGALSFLKKVDIAAPQDGVLARLFFREGDRVQAGDLVAIFENPQISLAKGRAENSYAQAEAALGNARARLLEGEFQAEARILEIKKAEAELVQAGKVLEERRRKQRDQEELYRAGGISPEALRNGRFSLESEEERLRFLERDLEIRRIGLREQDLLAAGFPPSGNEEEQRRALILLAAATLRTELAAAEARLAAAAKELESARLAEEELTLYSPSSGVVGGRYFEEGERVRREDKFLTLMDTDSLYAVFPLEEADALRLEKGMEAKVWLDGTGGEYGGRVDLVAPQADSQSFTFLVRVLISPEGTDTSPKPGMFARVTVYSGPPRTAAVIPESSLIRKKNNEAAVFVIRNNTLTERKVLTGDALGEDREIRSGLVPGEVVVKNPDTNLREGIYVSLAD